MTAEQLGDDPIIQKGDVLHCDVGITASAEHRHAAHGVRAAGGRDRVPAGLKQAMENANALQDIFFRSCGPGAPATRSSHSRER